MEFSVNDGDTSPTITRSKYLDELVGAWDTDGDSLVPTAATTQQELDPLPRTAPDAVASVVDAAREADWDDVPVEARCAVARSFKRLLFDHRDHLLTLLQLETGKSRDDAYEEFLGAVNATLFYATKAPDYLASEDHKQPIPKTDARTYHEPYGVAGLILPWNYPLALGVMDGLPALLAGNALVVKPSEHAPYTTLYMLSLLVEAGVPDDAIHAVIGEGDVGEAVVTDTDVVGFTGSTAVGRKVAEAAASQLTPVSLELGGKNPLLVLDGADPSKAAKGAINAAFTNTGQFCMATERAFIHENVYDDFIAALENEVRGLSVGVSYEYETDVGVLVAPFQQERVTEHVEQTIEAGATCLIGGTPLAGTPTGYEPTVLVDVPDDAVGMREETFGPVLYVQKVSSHEEAIAKANNTEYGLHASIWGPEDVGKRVATHINAGSVAVNDAFATVFSAASAPTGGWGDSGLGRRNGAKGIHRYTQTKTVSSNSGIRVGRPDWVPPAVYDRVIAAVYKYVPLYGR